MKTSKPISTISYNTPEFLKEKIEYWKREGIIEFAMWIYHKAEANEKKPHFHVFLKPAQLLQTMDLEKDSQEVDPNNPKNPLKMIGFRSAKEGDWLLYSIHDPAYIMEKGLERLYYYSFDDVQTTCNDTFKDIITHLSDDRKGRLEYRLIDCIMRGMTWQEIVSSGLIPLRYMTGAKIMYTAITGQQRDIS